MSLGEQKVQSSETQAARYPGTRKPRLADGREVGPGRGWPPFAGGRLRFRDAAGGPKNDVEGAYRLLACGWTMGIPPTVTTGASVGYPAVARESGE